MSNPSWMPLKEDGTPDLGKFLFRNLAVHLPGPAGASTEASDKTWDELSEEIKSAFRQAAMSIIVYMSYTQREFEAQLPHD